MLTIRRAVGGVLGSLLVLVALTPTSAQADQVCSKYDVSGICLIWINVPGGGGGGGGGGASGGGGGVGGSGGGGASNVSLITVKGQQCLLQGPASPQPPKSDPVWEGQTHGAIYDCEYSNGRFGAPVILPFWSATAPAAPPAPDPRLLAQQAMAAMNLRAINIGIVPDPRPGSVGVIGMPTWMWTTDPTPSTMGPITRSVSAGGYTVTATAQVTTVVWSMGDGAVVTCNGPGTPYLDSYGKKSSPTCGHTYTRQGTYTVRATTYWLVTWAGIGQTGTIPLDFTGTTNITMGEAQVLSN